MKELKLALIGFGNAGQAFAEMLLEKEKEIRERYQTRIIVVAITTKTRGNLVDAWGLDLDKALKNIRYSGRFDKSLGFVDNSSSQPIVDKVDYDVLIELTPLEFSSGKIATNHIRGALRRGKHAITANKGPVAWAYKELSDLAKEKGCKFLFETTVMDGAPIFNLKRDALRLCKVTEITGILNSTTNYILCELAKGREKNDIITEGKRRGFIEANPAADLDGYDAAAKVTALANVLMDANMSPVDVKRKGITDISKADIEKAAENGNTIKLMCRAYQQDGTVKGEVLPKEISNTDFYASIDGTSSVITLETDLMGTLSIIEGEPEVQQTAYGIFADMLSILEEL